MNSEQPKLRETPAQKQRKHDAAHIGRLKVYVDILDPSPVGKELAEEMPIRVAEDCAGFAEFSMLEPTGIAFISGADGCVVLRRHRIVLVVHEQRLSEVLGHVRAYCNTVLEGHPVMFEIEPVGYLA